MIDADELSQAADAEPFLSAWWSAWAEADQALTAVGWPNNRCGTFYGEMWAGAPEGVLPSAWASVVARVEADDAIDFAKPFGEGFVTDAALTLVNLQRILEEVAITPPADRTRVRNAALWGMHSARVFLRRHGQLATLKALDRAQQGLSRLSAEGNALAAETEGLKAEAASYAQKAVEAQTAADKGSGGLLLGPAAKRDKADRWRKPLYRFLSDFTATNTLSRSFQPVWLWRAFQWSEPRHQAYLPSEDQGRRVVSAWLRLPTGSVNP